MYHSTRTSILRPRSKDITRKCNCKHERSKPTRYTRVGYARTLTNKHEHQGYLLHPVTPMYPNSPTIQVPQTATLILGSTHSTQAIRQTIEGGIHSSVETDEWNMSTGAVIRSWVYCIATVNRVLLPALPKTELATCALDPERYMDSVVV